MTLSVEICLKTMNDFYLLYRKAYFYQDTLADYLGVSIQTIRRWEITNNPPIAVIKLLQLLANDLSHLGKEWSGFRFIAGELVTPEDQFVAPGKIRAHKYLLMTIDFRERENLKLKQQLAEMSSKTSFNRRVSI